MEMRGVRCEDMGNEGIPKQTAATLGELARPFGAVLTDWWLTKIIGDV
jgi:hypothetical protein